MQTTDTFSTREDTERLVKIVDSIYTKAELEQVDANPTHMNAEQKTLLLRLLKDFEFLFGGTLGDWDKDTVSL